MPDIVGYRTLDQEDLANITAVKEMEERCMRLADGLKVNAEHYDQRAVALYVTYLQIAFMWAVRAIAKPDRIPLPEEEESFLPPEAA